MNITRNVSVLLVFLSLTGEAASAGCTDYSGVWRGECVTQFGNEVSTDAALMAWEQDECRTHSDGTRTYVVGQVNTDEWRTSKYITERKFRSDWSAGSTELVFGYTIETKMREAPYLVISRTRSQGKSVIQNGQFIATSEGVLSTRKSVARFNHEPFTQVCTYDRVADDRR